MRRISTFTIAAVSALAASAAAVAIGSPYVALRGSLAFAEQPKSTISGVPLRASLDTGWGVSAAVGSEYGPVHFEFEGVYRNFAFNGVTSGGIAKSAHGSLEVIAPMANVILDFPLDRYMPFYGITPFIGAGIGGVHAAMAPKGTALAIRDDSSWGFGYQLMAGLSVPVANNVTMRIGYRYLAAPNMRFRATSGAGYKTDLAMHSVDLGLDFRF